MPSRSSFNTGYYPQETRVHGNPVQLPDTITTLPDRLREVGYHTASFGHIGGDGLGQRFDHKIDWWNSSISLKILRNTTISTDWMDRSLPEAKGRAMVLEADVPDPQLFNIQSDPLETIDLAPETPERTKRMKTELEKLV